MSVESLNLKLFYHPGATAGGRKEGGYIRVKERGRNSRGIHFHHTEPLFPEQATRLLRTKKIISRHETVLAVVNCGKDKKGVKGYAARTDAMAEPEEGSSLELLGIEFGALIPEDSTDLEE